MSIVVASTTLDTIWTEFSTVPYGASTLGTLSAMIDEVGLKIGRTISGNSVPTDTQVVNWLVRGKQEFAKTKGYTWRRRYVTSATVSGQYRYSMPQDYDGGYIVLRDKDNDRNISFISNYSFDGIYPDPDEETSANPIAATVKNTELWLCPPPDGAYTIEMEYMRNGDDETVTDFGWIPEPDRWVIVDFATAEALESVHDFDKATWHRQKYSGGVVNARRADSKRKWSSSEKRARSVFQAR